MDGLQEKDRDLLVPGHPRLGVRFPRDLIAGDVVVHQLDRHPPPQPRDLHRLPEQPHRPVQRQLGCFFLDPAVSA